MTEKDEMPEIPSEDEMPEIPSEVMIRVNRSIAGPVLLELSQEEILRLTIALSEQGAIKLCNDLRRTLEDRTLLEPAAVRTYEANCDFYRQRAADLTEQQLANLAWYLICAFAANLQGSDRWKQFVESGMKWAKEQS